MNLLCRIFSLENLRHLARDCSAATQIEYSLIVALVSVAVLSGASEVGSLVSVVFSKSSQSITQAAGTVQGSDGASNGASGAPASPCGPGNGNGNCANSGNGGGNTGGSGTGTGNGGQNNGQSGNSNHGGGGNGSGS